MAAGEQILAQGFGATLEFGIVGAAVTVKGCVEFRVALSFQGLGI